MTDRFAYDLQAPEGERFGLHAFRGQIGDEIVVLTPHLGKITATIDDAVVARDGSFCTLQLVDVTVHGQVGP